MVDESVRDKMERLNDRLTGLIQSDDLPFDRSDEITAQDLELMAHSWRHFEPYMFEEAVENSGMRDARAALKRVESGRFHNMLEGAHKFFNALDRDERQEFTRRNTDLVKWIGVFGLVEGLNTYEEYSGIESSF